jgi:DNA-binding NarL/FixJ family response regulator
MPRDREAAHLAVAARLPVDRYFLEEDLSVTMLRSLLARLDEREFPMPAPMAEFLLGQVRSPVPSPVRLSSGEQAVLQLIVDGATNKTIVDEFRISVHGSSIMWQTFSSSWAHEPEVASTAMRRGLVVDEPARSR